MGITILLLKYLTHPKERGFYCNDTSIRYPYHSSTVTTTVNNCVSYGIPLFIIIVKNIAQKPTLNTSKRTALIRDLIIRDISLFLFGVFTVQVYDLSQRFRTHTIKFIESHSTSSTSPGDTKRPSGLGSDKQQKHGQGKKCVRL